MEPTLYVGSNLDVLPLLRANSIDSIVTDPPYELTGKTGKGGFMGKTWDATGIAYSVELWAECLRVLKPGGLLLSFGGTRTFHRMAVAIEDAGFELEDTLHWTYGSGFPKSLDVSKAIDKAAGMQREVIGIKVNTYDGANRNPNKHGNPADQANIGKWGLTKTPHGMPETEPATPAAQQWSGFGTALKPSHEPIVVARKPAAARTFKDLPVDLVALNARGSIMYFPKANKKERPVVNGVSHATVKPLALMRYLIQISTPEGGVVLDPFAGSGTTMEAAVLEQRGTVGIELTVEHVPLIQARMERQGIDLGVSE